MIQEEVKINNGSGLQARAAAMFVQIANKFRASVWVEKNNRRVDGKSILGLMSMAIPDGASAKLIVSGDDEKEAWQYFLEFFDTPFDEKTYVEKLAKIPNHNDPDEMEKFKRKQENFGKTDISKVIDNNDIDIKPSVS